MARRRSYRRRTRTIVRRVTKYRVRRPSRRQVKSGGMNFGRLIGRSVKDGLAITAARRIPDFAGPYQGAADKVIAGVGLKLFKQGGSALIEVGLAEFIANGVDQYVVPALGGILGGAVQATGAATQQAGAQISNLSAYRA